MQARLPEATEPRPDDWVSECLVCLGAFSVRAVDSPQNPAPTGSFCPDCRENRRVAPGVLHWFRRSEQ